MQNVPIETLESFRTRIRMRLALARQAIVSAQAERDSAVELLRTQGKDLLSKQELDSLGKSINTAYNCTQQDLSPLIDDLDEMTCATWQTLFYFQEKYIGVLMLSLEEPMILRKAISEAFSTLIEKSAKKLRSVARSRNKPVKQEDPKPKHITPEIDAMQQAMEKY